MKSILVTGSNGLIGGKVVEALLEKGYFVTGVSMEEKGKITHERFSYISVDLTRSQEVERIFSEKEFLAVVHLAAIAHVFKGIHISWSKYYRVNTMISSQIFQCVAERNIPIFFSSTVDVYGIQNKIINENTVPNPIGFYAKSKYLAEGSLINSENERYVIARFAPVYTDNDHRDIHRRYYIRYPKICYLIGNGMKYHFLSSDNVVDIVLKWVNEPEKIQGIINVYDRKEYDTKELIQKDKETGAARHVIRIPKWLRKITHVLVDIVFGKIPFLKFTAYKIICPMKFESTKMKKIYEQ